jgi:hypothetical protein
MRRSGAAAAAASGAPASLPPSVPAAHPGHRAAVAAALLAVAETGGRAGPEACGYQGGPRRLRVLTVANNFWFGPQTPTFSARRLRNADPAAPELPARVATRPRDHARPRVSGFLGPNTRAARALPVSSVGLGGAGEPRGGCGAQLQRGGRALPPGARRRRRGGRLCTAGRGRGHLPLSTEPLPPHHLHMSLISSRDTQWRRAWRTPRKRRRGDCGELGVAGLLPGHPALLQPVRPALLVGPPAAQAPCPASRTPCPAAWSRASPSSSFFCPSRSPPLVSPPADGVLPGEWSGLQAAQLARLPRPVYNNILPPPDSTHHTCLLPPLRSALASPRQSVAPLSAPPSPTL